MSKHLSGWRDNAAYAAAICRAEGWQVRRIATDVWKVSDRNARYRDRPGMPFKKRHFFMNRDQLLDFAGVPVRMPPLGRSTHVRVPMKIMRARYPVEDADIPF
ncbi:hypothetical protein [Novosphingobium sp.]|uniref:hypothetical protein n=1 Tax=Novosphingobium sp. TaxID=1874826 RepID=UPI0031CF0531